MRALAVLAGMLLFALLATPAAPARADSCEDADGMNVSVSGTIAGVEQEGNDLWWVTIRESIRVAGCPLDGIYLSGRPSTHCAIGRKIEVSGEFVDDFFDVLAYVDARSYACY